MAETLKREDGIGRHFDTDKAKLEEVRCPKCKSMVKFYFDPDAVDANNVPYRIQHKMCQNKECGVVDKVALTIH